MSRAHVALILLLAGACARPGHPATQAPVASVHAFSAWDSVTTVRVTDGVAHISAWTAAGPWAVQVLEVDLRVCRPVLEARKPGPPLSARATTSALARNAIAAINADFFMLPGGSPVGAHVSDGVVLAGPARRVAFFVTELGYSAGQGRVQGVAVTRSDSARIEQVNRPLEGDARHDPPAHLVLYTTWLGDTLAASPAAPLLRLRPLDARTAVVVRLDTATVTVEGGTLAMRAGARAESWLRRRSPGDTVGWHVLLVTEDGTPVREAVGGFPMLVSDGRDVVAGQTGIAASFGPARHPRTAVGWAEDRMWWVVVDGRREGWSAGMSLDELADLMLELGAGHALNLDGGGSTAMVVADRVVNRPSDATGERAVGNALALAACR